MVGRQGQLGLLCWPKLTLKKSTISGKYDNKVIVHILQFIMERILWRIGATAASTFLIVKSDGLGEKCMTRHW